MGSNPPLDVMKGFFSRIWDTKVEKVIANPKGVFIVRFHSTLEQDNALKKNFVYFDKKPLIMEAWAVEQPVDKEAISKVPVWLNSLNLI